jgi:hypothetical protein
LVPISGTPIGSGIPIPFLIPKIPFNFFSNSAVENQEIGIPTPKFGILKKINVGIQYTSFCINHQSE